MFYEVSSAPKKGRIKRHKGTAPDLTSSAFQRALGLGLGSPKVLVAAAA